MYYQIYKSPIGELLMISDETSLYRLVFYDENEYDLSQYTEKNVLVLQETKAWLDAYFNLQKINPLPPFHLSVTSFQKEVLGEVLKIPFGQTETYVSIARKFNDKMSAQAIGQALNKNPILIMIPCHRVVGKNKGLTGYSAGVHHKKDLLQYEGIEL